MKQKKKSNQNKEKEEKEEKKIIFEKLSAFFDKYMSNNKLIVKNATLFDVTRILYIKGKDFKHFFDENFNEIQKEIQSITKINIGKEANKDSLQKFYSINQQYSIMHYLKRIPGDKAKYPKKLLPLTKEDDINLDNIFNESGFYILQIKTEKSNKPLIYLSLLIFLVLFVVLFPIWPLNVKLGVLYFLLGCMIFLIAFLVLTIVLSILAILFGYDLDIMPNIDNSKMSWKDRIINPFYICEKREDPCWGIVVRIILIILIIAICIIGYFFPRLPKAFYRIIKNLMVNLFSYGKQKIEDIHYHRNEVAFRDNQYLEDLDNI